MARLPSVGRDAAILSVVAVLSLAVLVFVPPSGPPSAVSTAGAAAGTHSGNERQSSGSGQAATASAGTSNGGGGNGSAKRVKLMDSKYAPYAYLISGKNLSSKAKRALDGFHRKRTRVNATAVRITLVPTESQYKRYSVVVRKGQKLYFIEASFGDDAPQRETQLSDDAPVKVNRNGYVV